MRRSVTIITDLFKYFIVLTYNQQIIDLLLMVGERGISVSALSKHVYNQNCTFFSRPDLEEVKRSVKRFLQRNSKTPHSLVVRTERRGYYRLNTSRSSAARQLLLDFRNDRKRSKPDSTEEKTSSQDLSLDLFTDEF